MGIAFSSFFTRITGLFAGDKEVRILMLGLDASKSTTRPNKGSNARLSCVHVIGGKTTILYRFQIGTVVETLPTIGFNVETLTYKNLKLQVG